MAFPTFTYRKESSTEQQIALLPGTTIRDVLEQDGVNPSKVTVMLNDTVTTDYARELEDGDDICISPRNLSNGAAI